MGLNCFENGWTYFQSEIHVRLCGQFKCEILQTISHKCFYALKRSHCRVVTNWQFSFLPNDFVHLIQLPFTFDHLFTLNSYRVPFLPFTSNFNTIFERFREISCFLEIIFRRKRMRYFYLVSQIVCCLWLCSPTTKFFFCKCAVNLLNSLHFPKKIFRWAETNILNLVHNINKTVSQSNVTLHFKLVEWIIDWSIDCCCWSSIPFNIMNYSRSNEITMKIAINSAQKIMKTFQKIDV